MPRRITDDDYYQAHPMTENELKKSVLTAAYAQGWSVYHVPQSTMRNGGGTGYPDLTLARGGKIMWMELKQEKAGLSPAQVHWQGELGPYYHVVRPTDWATGRIAELLA